MGFTVGALICLGILLVAGEIYRCSRVRFRRLEILLTDSGMVNDDEISILHLSDLHITARSAGRLGQISYLKERSWDFVIVSGDLIDDDSGIAPVCDCLSGLRAVYGKYAVLGNHDFFRLESHNPLHYLKLFWDVVVLGRHGNSKVPNDVDKLIETLGKSGTVLLRNELSAGSLASGKPYQVFGIDDPTTGFDNPEPLYEMADSRALRLVVTHSPKRIGRVAPLRPALVFCGHTHGGQIRLPLFGALATRSDARRKACAGLVEQDGCRLHISPGFGAGEFFSMRFMSGCEVSEIVLKAPDNDK